MTKEPELYCDSCGRKLEDREEIRDESLSPRVEGEITCDDCYHREYCDRCVVCDDIMRKEDTKYVLFAEEFQGIATGCYEFIRPWYASGVIEMHIFPRTLTKIRELHSDEENSGYVCATCVMRHVKPMQQRCA